MNSKAKKVFMIIQLILTIITLGVLVFSIFFREWLFLLHISLIVLAGLIAFNNIKYYHMRLLTPTCILLALLMVARVFL